MTARFELRPLGLWDRPTTDPRASSARFRAHWDDTVYLLQREVEHLDGWLIAVQVDVTDGEIRRDGMLRSRTRVDFPGVKVSFDSKHGPLTYATDAYDTWQANVRAIALGLEALRAVDRYGITRTGEQYRGWSQITAAPAEADLTRDEAARVLADAADIPAQHIVTSSANVNHAYRTAVQTAHPDRGGNPDVFRLVTRARDVLLGASS